MEKSEMNNGMRKGMSYFGNVLKVTLGAGAALGGAYLLSRVGEKQDAEASLSRLEQMLAELAETEGQDKVVGKRKR
jgi:hypothetical protein